MKNLDKKTYFFYPLFVILNCFGINLLTTLWPWNNNDDRKSIYECNVWKHIWVIVLVWRSEQQHWPSNRVTDSTCCPADLWATYHSPTRRTAAPWVTGLHLPASHSITADSVCKTMGRRRVGGHSQVHGPNVSSRGWVWREQRSQRSQRHFEWRDVGWDNKYVALWWEHMEKITVGVIILWWVSGADHEKPTRVYVTTKLILFLWGDSRCGCALSN